MNGDGRSSALTTAFAIFLSLSGCGGGGGGGTVTSGVTVEILASPTLYASQSTTLTARVAGTTNQKVNWEVESANGGTITADGIYTAPAGAGTFVVRATSQADASASDTTTVKVLQAPAGGIPMTTAHRTSGVAPLSVFFDAVNDTAASSPRYRFAWSSGVTQPTDLEGAQYVWDFGDPGSGSWSTTGRSRNSATGFTAAHVYEAPGTYKVTLVVTDPANAAAESRYTQTITVADPDTVFASTTRYVAASGSPLNPGTEAQPYATIAQAMADVAAGTAKRVLLRRGDTFNVTEVYTITAGGPGLIGTYGSGAKPVLNVAELGINAAFTTRAADWRFVDLDFRGPGLLTDTAAAGPAPEHQGVNELFLRLSAQNFAVGYGWSEWAEVAAGSPHDGMFIVECDEPVRPGSYGAFVGGRRLAILGNRFRGGQNPTEPAPQPQPGTHTLRVWLAHKAVISNNELLDTGGQRHALKLHGAGSGFPLDPETRWVSISDNLIRASNTSQWTVSMGSQSTAADEASPVSHVIFERNTFTASPSTIADIEAEASHVVVRNNVFDDALGSGVTALIWQQRNALVQTPSDIRIYNNTAYQTATFLQTDSTLSNARVRNNLVATPGSAPVLVDGVAGAGFVQDHNVLTDEPAGSVFTNVALGNFALAVDSPGANAGTTLNDVLNDILLQDRPVGLKWDAGAYESH